MKVQLTAGFLSEAVTQETENSLEKEVMLVYPGKFKSMTGDVTVTDEQLDKMMSNHNTRLSQVAKLAEGKEVHAKNFPPLQLDHSRNATHTIGRIVGPLTRREVEINGKKCMALFSVARFLGKENVEKAKDGRYTHVSVGADFDEGYLSEVSVTPFPAASEASLLAKENESPKEERMKHKEMKEKVARFEKCRKYLMDVKKMSEEDADKQLEEANDDTLSAMARESDDHEARMAEEAEKEEKEKQEKEQKLAASKDAVTKLMAPARDKLSAARLSHKKARIGVRLSALRMQGKISPAEIKTTDITKLAAMDDTAIDAALGTYEKRQPVIMIGMYGTTKGVDLSKVQSRADKDQLLRKRDQIKNMSSLGKERQDQMLKEIDTQLSAAGGSQGNSEDQNDQAQTLAISTAEDVLKLLTENKVEEAKTKLKELTSAARDTSVFLLDEKSNSAIDSLAAEIEGVHNQLKTTEEAILKLLTDGGI